MAPKTHASTQDGSPPQRSHLKGPCMPPGHRMAPNLQAPTQAPHLVHEAGSTIQAPVAAAFDIAPEGHAAAQGASSHWRQ
jgi:hypothetical protein